MAQESIASLLDEIRLADRGLSARNPNKVLLQKCAVAITQLAEQLHVAKRAAAPQRRWWQAWLFRARREA